MAIERILYAAVILCFIVVHYIALRQIDAKASHAVLSPSSFSQPTD
jgi:hypothetical protein